MNYNEKVKVCDALTRIVRASINVSEDQKGLVIEDLIQAHNTL